MKDRIEDVRAIIVETERAVSELYLSLLGEANYMERKHLARACRRADLGMANLRMQIDQAMVTWAQDLVEG